MQHPPASAPGHNKALCCFAGEKRASEAIPDASPQALRSERADENVYRKSLKDTKENLEGIDSIPEAVRQMFSVALLYESDPNDSNFRAMHQRVLLMDAAVTSHKQTLRPMSPFFPVPYRRVRPPVASTRLGLTRQLIGPRT